LIETHILVLTLHMRKASTENHHSLTGVMTILTHL